MAKPKNTKTGVRQLDADYDPTKEAAQNAAGVGSGPANTEKVHIFNAEAFELVNANYLGCKSKFTWDSWRARVEFLRKEKGDAAYQLTADDVKALIFTEPFPEGLIDAVDKQPLTDGKDNVVALIVIPKEKDGHANPNGGDLLRDSEGNPKERGSSVTWRAEGTGPQPLEVLTFSERNRKTGEQLARTRKLHLTSYRQATARIAAINGTEGSVNDFLARKGAVRRERDERNPRDPQPTTPRGKARFER